MPNLPSMDYMHDTIESLLNQKCCIKKCDNDPTIIFIGQLARLKGLKPELYLACSPEHRFKLYTILEKHHKMRYMGRL